MNHDLNSVFTLCCIMEITYHISLFAETLEMKLLSAIRYNDRLLFALLLSLALSLVVGLYVEEQEEMLFLLLSIVFVLALRLFQHKPWK